MTRSKKVADPPALRDVWDPELPYFAYNDSIELLPSMRIEDIEGLVEQLRGIGDATWTNRIVTFEMRSFTEWDLREVMIEASDIIENWANAGAYAPVYGKVSRHDA